MHKYTYKSKIKFPDLQALALPKVAVNDMFNHIKIDDINQNSATFNNSKRFSANNSRVSSVYRPNHNNSSLNQPSVDQILS